MRWGHPENKMVSKYLQCKILRLLKTLLNVLSLYIKLVFSFLKLKYSRFSGASFTSCWFPVRSRKMGCSSLGLESWGFFFPLFRLRLQGPGSCWLLFGRLVLLFRLSILAQKSTKLYQSCELKPSSMFSLVIHRTSVALRTSWSFLMLSPTSYVYLIPGLWSIPMSTFRCWHHLLSKFRPQTISVYQLSDGTSLKLCTKWTSPVIGLILHLICNRVIWWQDAENVN